MRFCNSCGNAIGEERFCNKCGTDNGEVVSEFNDIPGVEPSPSIFTAGMSQLNLPVILYWVSVGLFGIVALVLFFTTLTKGTSMVANSLLYKGNPILAIIGYIIGFWGMIPLILAGLNFNKKDAKLPVSVSIAMLLVMIVLAIFRKIGGGDFGLFGGISVIFSLYSGATVWSIVLSVLSVAAGIASMQVNGQKGE